VELQKIWGFPFNIYAMAETSDFKFGTQHGMPIRCIRKLHEWHGSLQNLAFFFATAEVAVAVPNKRYYIILYKETANINIKAEFIYKYYRLTHQKQQKLECEFSCGARRRGVDVLYN